MERDCDSAIARAEAENWGYHRLLHHLAQAEIQDRRTRKIERVLKGADIPADYAFARFDEAKMPEKARRMLPTLMSGDFVRRGDNLVAGGFQDRGKSGFAGALIRELAERHGMKVLFIPAFKLAARLVAAKREMKLVKILAKLNRYDAIQVDELGGYVDFAQEEIDVLFTFFGERYEKQKSVFVTTNLAFSEWGLVFKNPMTATAIVDRFVHRCVILEFTAPASARRRPTGARPPPDLSPSGPGNAGPKGSAAVGRHQVPGPALSTTPSSSNATSILNPRPVSSHDRPTSSPSRRSRSSGTNPAFAAAPSSSCSAFVRFQLAFSFAFTSSRSLSSAWRIRACFFSDVIGLTPLFNANAGILSSRSKPYLEFQGPKVPSASPSLPESAIPVDQAGACGALGFCPRRRPRHRKCIRQQHP